MSKESSSIYRLEHLDKFIEYQKKYREKKKQDENYLEKSKEYQMLAKNVDIAIKKLFNLKDMVYKPETREINFDIQREISTIIKILALGDKE